MYPEIIDYILESATRDQQTRINIGLADGTNWDILPISPAHFTALAVMLQNEKPLYYNFDTGVIYTGPEPTGGTVDTGERG